MLGPVLPEAVFLSYFGVRVRALARSVRFYRDLFGLQVAGSSDWETAPETEARSVMLRDPASGQRLELNYYPPGDPHAVEYGAGEELDHLGFRVDDLPEFLRKLADRGVEPEPMKHYAGPMLVVPGLRVAYVRDPDGIQLELFDHGEGGSPTFEPDRY